MVQQQSMTLTVYLKPEAGIRTERRTTKFPRVKEGTFLELPEHAPQNMFNIDVLDTSQLADEISWDIIDKVYMKVAGGKVQIDQQGQSILTFGQSLVGLKFNPSNDDQVGKIKQAFAGLADLVMEETQPEKTDSYLFNTIKGDCIRTLLHAQMVLVKLVTLKF